MLLVLLQHFLVFSILYIQNIQQRPSPLERIKQGNDKYGKQYKNSFRHLLYDAHSCISIRFNGAGL